MSATQCAKVLTHLKRRPITTYQAYDLYKITRLPDRVRDLREKGIQIHGEMITSREGKRCKRYWLA